LGKKTGIDLLGEASGFLPDPTEKEKRTKTPWRLGDTYNVSIGQGDLLMTPVQLINYIALIANNGKNYRPFINKEKGEQVLIDLSSLLPEIKEVQKGMVDAVEKSYGTAYSLSGLPFSIAAKTGTAQIQANHTINAIFVGYAPVENPQIAVLILIENAKEGSINTLPIAKDVLLWYYNNRIEL
ncbi:penicillin-binding protein 2, partial [Candidatus Wolfebacteria bacterium CG03_land_8_20_14_0_80_36_15]